MYLVPLNICGQGQHENTRVALRSLANLLWRILCPKRANNPRFKTSASLWLWYEREIMANTRWMVLLTLLAFITAYKSQIRFLFVCVTHMAVIIKTVPSPKRRFIFMTSGDGPSPSALFYSCLHFISYNNFIFFLWDSSSSSSSSSSSWKTVLGWVLKGKKESQAFTKTLKDN